MKQYKVKTHLLDRYSKGEEIPKSTMNDLLDVGCPESWFEPIEEEFSVGDWVIVGFKGGEEDDFAIVKYSNDERTVGFGHCGREWTEKFNISNAIKWGDIKRKATPDEIEQALIAEAKRRGYGAGVRIDNSNLGHGYNYKMRDFGPYYKESRDLLCFGGAYIYKQGNWAEIADEPITINGYEVEFTDSNYIKVGCSPVAKETFNKLNIYISNHDLTIRRRDEDITEQIKQIAQRL